MAVTDRSANTFNIYSVAKFSFLTGGIYGPRGFPQDCYSRRSSRVPEMGSPFPSYGVHFLRNQLPPFNNITPVGAGVNTPAGDVA
jgi:hypothetical protein